MSDYRGLKEKLEKELDTISEQCKTGAAINENDLKRIDLLTHSLKSLECIIKAYEDKERQNYQQGYQESYQQGRYYGPGYSRDNMDVYYHRSYPPEYNYR